MNFYNIKCRILNNDVASIESDYLIETNFEYIAIYSISIGYNKLSNISSVLINNVEYDLTELKNYCKKLIPLETLYIKK
jgi:hypothetical protein